MTALGAFQRAQMKRGDPRVAELFVHVRRAVEILEKLALHPMNESLTAPSQPVPRKAGLPPAIEPERLAYSIKEVCKLVGISRSTCYRLVGEGSLPTIKFGSRILGQAKALREWLNGLPGSS